MPRGRHPHPRANLIEGEPGCAVCRAARLGNPVPGPARRPPDVTSMAGAFELRVPHLLTSAAEHQDNGNR
ncbi:hypothetical protein [Streptomyces goshikiensis]|uniref:hypothetical protein n=1 Tax=Streptomyces goshikiensis TaxID=1942 RepID=UPI0036617F34